jgi:hypothetical protein
MGSFCSFRNQSLAKPKYAIFLYLFRIKDISVVDPVLGLLDPDPDQLVKGTDPDPSIIKQK